MSIPIYTAVARISERRSFPSGHLDGAIDHVSERLRSILATVNVASFIAAISWSGPTRFRLIPEIGNS